MDAWAAAAEENKATVLQAAFVVRQIEVGLAAIESFLFGTAVTLYGLTLVVDPSRPRWLGWLAAWQACQQR